jgi:methionyl-tRNA formyltransferase
MSLRVGFLGYEGWGLATLRAIREGGHHVAWVVTHAEGGPLSTHSFTESVLAYATAHGIPAVEARTTREPQVMRLLANAQADVAVTSNWRTHVDGGFLAALPLGGINVHRSLLPRYRGLSPLNWAIVEGAPETGVTVHLLADELDTGDILGQTRIPIGPTDTATDLFHVTGAAIAELVPRVLAALAEGRATRTPQDPRGTRMYSRRRESDWRIDWTRPAAVVHDLVRAQSSPFPNAFTHHDGRVLRIVRCRPLAGAHGGPPGRVAACSEAGAVVTCGSGEDAGAVLVPEVALDGQGAMAAGAYFTRPGATLG